MNEYLVGITHVEYGYILVKADSEAEAKEKAEELGCDEMEVNKCEFEIGEATKK